MVFTEVEPKFLSSSRQQEQRVISYKIFLTKVIEILLLLRCAKGRPVRKPFLQVVDTAAATALAVRLAVSARLAR